MRWLLLLVLIACKSKPAAPTGQSFHDGVQALCDLPDHVPAGATPEQRLAGVATWSTANITNGEVVLLTGKKDALAAAAQKAGVAPCKLVDNDMALQSFTAAMKLVCNAPATADPAYYKSNLLNPEVIALFGALGNLSPADRSAKMQAAVDRAALGSCALFEKMAAATVEHAPAITGGMRLSELAPRGVTVVASQSMISIDQKALVSVANGVATDLPVVDRYLAAEVQARGTPLPRLQIEIDPKLPASMLASLVTAADRAGFRDLALVVNADGASRAIPFARAGAPTGLELVIGITADKLVLYSANGQEGTAQQPKASVATPAELVVALVEIASRRFKVGQRTDDDRRIIVAPDPTVTVQRVADVLAVIRATKDGNDLFPLVTLR